MSKDERPSFFTDEHIGADIVEGLRRLGVNVVSVNEVGRRTLGDDSHLDWATANRRVVVTHDTDFIILAAAQEHAGVAFCQMEKYDIGGMIRSIHALWERETDESCANRVQYL